MQMETFCGKEWARREGWEECGVVISGEDLVAWMALRMEGVLGGLG